MEVFALCNKIMKLMIDFIEKKISFTVSVLEIVLIFLAVLP